MKLVKPGCSACFCAYNSMFPGLNFYIIWQGFRKILLSIVTLDNTRSA